MTRKRLSGSEKRRRRKQRLQEQPAQQGAAQQEQEGAAQQEQEGAAQQAQQGAAFYADELRCTVCYGGEEDGPLLTPCACANEGIRYYHYDCVSRLIIVRRDLPCRVCGDIYTDLRIRRTPRTYLDFVRHNQLIVGLCGVVVMILLFLSLMYVFIIAEPDPTEFAMGVIAYLSILFYHLFQLSRRAQLFFRRNQIIHFRDFDGQNVVMGTTFEFRLQDVMDADDQQLLQDFQQELIQEEFVGQMKAQLWQQQQQQHQQQVQFDQGQNEPNIEEEENLD